jgi:hypothetical protein
MVDIEKKPTQQLLPHRLSFIKPRTLPALHQKLYRLLNDLACVPACPLLFQDALLKILGNDLSDRSVRSIADSRQLAYDILA